MAAASQFLMLLAAGGLLFAWWRRVAESPRPLVIIVGLGFIARAVAAPVVFWISYLELPLARSQQTGNGFWAYASDGKRYFSEALTAAAGGLSGIVQYPNNQASPAFVKALALAIHAFGGAASVALLLNLLCYAATCLILLRWARTSQSLLLPVTIALAAISFSPSALLWFLQPLKDTFFVFLVVAFIGACVAWQAAWRDGAPARAVLPGIAILVGLYALAGVRWYFGLIVLAVAAVFIILVAAAVARNRRVFAAIAALTMLLLLPRFYLWSARAYVPAPILTVLRPATFGPAATELPAFLTRTLNGVRTGFELTGGNSTIGLGKKMAEAEAAKGTAEVVRVRTYRKVAAAPVPVAAAPQPAAPLAVKPAPAPQAPAVVQPAVVQPAALAVQPAAPVTTAVAAPAPAVVPERVPEGQSDLMEVVFPKSIGGRVMAGAVAIVVPRILAQRLGILEIRGGGGAWLIAELDTLVFDVALVFMIWMLLRHRHGLRLRNPVAWLVLGITVAITVPLMYTVTNYGTLFRLREMILVGIALVPMALATYRGEEERAAPPSPA